MYILQFLFQLGAKILKISRLYKYFLTKLLFAIYIIKYDAQSIFYHLHENPLAMSYRLR